MEKQVFTTMDNLNETLFEMRSILNINPLLEKARHFMKDTDEETHETLRETLSITARRKLARCYADYMARNTSISLSPAFQEKLDTYLVLSSRFEGDQSDNRLGNTAGTEKAPTSSVEALVGMYTQTKAAIESNKAGDIFDCLVRLQAGQASPRTRSAADCCLRHLERTLCEQILAEGNRLGLSANDAIYPWYELSESLKEESCRRHPKEYFEFFRYYPEQYAFGFDSDAFDRAIRPF